MNFNSRTFRAIKIAVEAIEHLELARTKLAASEMGMDHEIRVIEGLKESAYREIQRSVSK